MHGTIWNAFLLLLVLLIPMVYLPRLLQREIQLILLMLTRQADLSMALFSLMFLPGVLLHESSHFIMAQILGVNTGKFSIFPRRLDNGQIRLGYVETENTDFFRDSLIGLAPLLTGGAFVALVGVYRLGLQVVWSSVIQGQLSDVISVFISATERPDFWLWFYLIFTVSSTMMPSAADRRAWVPVILGVLLLLGLVLLVGIGPWLMTHFELALTTGLNAINLIFGMTIILHIIIFPPTWLIRKITSRITHLQAA
jgi:hypothetical protein